MGKRKPQWRRALGIEVPERIFRQIVRTECVLFYCGDCPHILIERGGARKKKCPMCKGGLKRKRRSRRAYLM